MSALSPLETLYDATQGRDLPLPPELARLYGALRFPPHPGRAYVIGNFVETIDGVVSLSAPGHSGGGDISGFDAHDRMILGLLRAVCDVVIVGAGTLRSLPDHLWTPSYADPAFAEVYQQLRTNLGKSERPLTVIVTARGILDLRLPVFQSGEAPVLIVTPSAGARRIGAQDIPPSVHVAAVESAGPLTARSILDAVGGTRPSELIVVEGGPHLMGDFLAERCLDALFLTIAPQVAGRDSLARPGLVAGHLFAPVQPLWGTLESVKRGDSHLFLRYSFATNEAVTG